MKKINGLLDLIRAGVDKGTTAVEDIHSEIIKQHFAAVQKVPVIARIAASAQEIQLHHTGSIYSIIRLVNQEVCLFTKLLINGADKLMKDSTYPSLTAGDDQSALEENPHWYRNYADFCISVTNGIIGDFLQKDQNGLAIPMQFYFQGQALGMTQHDIEKSYSRPTSKICIMIHGLSCNERTWEYHSDPSTTYGTLLQKDLGYTPFYIRYNSGLHISENGRRFSALLTDLVKAYPRKIEEIVLIGHSMGGLVIRSGCWYGRQEQADWTNHVKKIIYLASPHLGAPLEKFGNVVSGILKRVPFPYTKLVADIINTRSSGIKDLRFGNVTDEDWAGHDPDGILENNKNPIPLMAGPSHYVIAGSLTRDASHCFTQLIGDPMVQPSSAFGRSGQPGHCLSFSGYRSFPEVGHIRLARSHKVYQQIKAWCEPAV